jgi:hypothetical protein
MRLRSKYIELHVQAINEAECCAECVLTRMHTESHTARDRTAISYEMRASIRPLRS